MSRRILVAALVLACSANAQDDYAAQTAETPTVDVRELELRLRPLRLEQVEKEVEAWIDVLRSRTADLSSRQIELRTAGDDARAPLIERIATLQAEQSSIAERIETVLKAYRDRGGDSKPFDAYVAASTGFGLGDTQDVSAVFELARNWVTSPDGGIRLGINVFQFLLTLLAFHVLARLVASIAHKTMARVKTASHLLRDFFVNAVSRVTFFIGLVVALSMLEIDVTPFLAAIGAAGFVIGFALQGTLSNFAAGLMILIYRPYDVGDVVVVAGKTGKVDKMTLVSTTLRLFDNQTVIVPNSSIWGDVITNVTSETTRRVDMQLGCGYGDDLKKAQRVLTEIVTAHPKVLADPEPVVRLHALADSSINFVVRPWCRTDDYWDVFWDVTSEVKRRFDEEGISIPFPQRDVHVHQVAT